MPLRALKRILHIDDEPDILAVAAYGLRKAGGYEVKSGSSGSEALLLAKSFQPDLILLDVMMPLVDGMQVLTALRADPATVAIPVVYLTARVQSSDVTELLRTGADAVIRKPFEPMALCRELEAIWAHAQRGAATEAQDRGNST